ncbi:DUF6789 family protein [Flagellimonas sp. CMM7]|uniref:DUF6789 family protein n=1 Tax=Flagellimonas sp. CMM7 TaxID=2654676 RepID=UPI0013D59196|nr:DUF6789 family protein [Flagellimonas sp. CMM7]UII80327.1 hypothetical protein LV704_02160 [Flagellimonas sp. CMM7]
MNTKIKKSITVGITATIIMSLVMMITAMFGMPKMSPPKMVSNIVGAPLAVGWVMHFVIGVVFAALYMFLFQPKIKIGNRILRGVVYGIVIFILAQIGFGVLDAIFGGGETPGPEGSMLPMVIGGIMGHIIFAITVVLMVKDPNPS